MIKVILDSNFLFVPFQFKTDIFDELEGLLGRFEPIVLSTTLEEIKSLLRKRSEKIRREASAALELAKQCKIIKVEKKLGESYDIIILRTAKEWKCLVATNDKTLRKKLRDAKIATIFLRKKSLLMIEGYPA